MMAVNIFKVLVISIIFGFAIGNPQEHHGHHDQKEENSVLKVSIYTLKTIENRSFITGYLK